MLAASRLVALAALCAWSLSARAAPVVQVAPAKVRPGDPLLVTVRGVTKPPEGELAGRPLRFWPISGGFRALAGLPVEQAAGPLAIEVRAAGETAPLRTTVQVAPAAWRVRELKVAPGQADPPPEVQGRIEADKAAFAAAFGRPWAPPRFERAFAKPRKASITAPFGDKRTFNGTLASQHYGLDLDGRVGAPVSAANDGVVVMVRDCYSSGRTVLVDHGAGLVTAYFHLSRSDVEPGARVQRGQRLGLVGKSGRVTGPHLHFGAKVGDLWIDPATLLALDWAR